MACAILAVTMSACERDMYGDLFVTRKSATFHVQSADGQSLPNVRLMTEELDALDGDLIVNGTHYATTDTDGLVTVKAVFDEEPGYSHLGERTTRFSFTATDYAEYDTVFNYWEDTIDIVLLRE
ncbi:MAG: hypothetical protein J6X79_00760 [Bacteroidales bacterium]|nr:hypothetical protein [Bacteroidales bacterium]